MSEKAPILNPGLNPERKKCKGKAVFRAVGVAAAVALVFHQFDIQVPFYHEDNDLCLTPACVHAASEILYNLSPKYKELDPCTDFEELVCGGWRDRHDLRADQGDAFTGTIMSETSELILRHVVEASYSESQFNGADKDNFNKMKAAYTACLDEDRIKDLGIRPLQQVVDDLGQLFSAESVSLKDAVLFLGKYGISSLVSLGTGADDRDPDSVVVSVSPPWSFGLPSKEYYKNDKTTEKYLQVARSVLENLLPSQHDNTYSSMLDLEKKLAEASPSTEEREDVTKYYNPMSVDEADKLAPGIELANLIKALAPADVPVNRIIVASPSYMKALSTIISETETHVLQAFFTWKAVQHLASSVEADVLKPLKRFDNELAGKDPDSTPERWRKCLSHVDNGLGWISSRFFVEKAFSSEAKEFGDTIIQDIRTEFAKKLTSTDWMDEGTTGKAIDKVHNIFQKIGYPTQSPNIEDPEALRAYYQPVNVSSTTFFENVLSMRAFDVDFEWSDLGKPVDRERWGMTVPTVNAYYNPPGNEIVFPAGIMQFPVFDVEVPAYVSYGAFGSVAGHELSHAFDSTGRHYDPKGNYTDWWSNSTVDAFKERAECFVDQYSKFSVEGPDGKPLHVNGRLTLGENIADAGGLSASFQAWKRRSTEKANQDLPGLDFFTQEQLFFVSYSNWWCGKTRKDAAVKRIYLDPHAPKWARVLGTMANSREFRESFQCPVKEPTCELW